MWLESGWSDVVREWSDVVIVVSRVGLMWLESGWVWLIDVVREWLV